MVRTPPGLQSFGLREDECWIGNICKGCIWKKKKRINMKVVKGIQNILGFYIYPAVTFSSAVTTLQSLHAWNSLAPLTNFREKHPRSELSKIEQTDRMWK